MIVLLGSQAQLAMPGGVFLATMITGRLGVALVQGQRAWVARNAGAAWHLLRTP